MEGHGVKIYPMELHDDPGRMLLKFREQHAQVLGEFHGDLVARAPETEFRFADQGEPRRITRSATLLETALKSRERRQTKESTLQARSSNGFSMVLVDGHGTVVRTKLFPYGDDGQRLKPVPYVPGRQPILRPDSSQLSLEDELGEPFCGGDNPMAPPPGFAFYVLWWPGSLGLGGAELAAGWVKNKVEPVLYATLPLPEPIMEVRDTLSGAPGAVATPLAVAKSSGSKKPRRMDDDFDSVVAPEEAAPPQSPS